MRWRGVAVVADGRTGSGQICYGGQRGLSSARASRGVVVLRERMVALQAWNGAAGSRCGGAVVSGCCLVREQPRCWCGAAGRVGSTEDDCADDEKVLLDAGAAAPGRWLRLWSSDRVDDGGSRQCEMADAVMQQVGARRWILGLWMSG